MYMIKYSSLQLLCKPQSCIHLLDERSFHTEKDYEIATNPFCTVP
jgi:hypothetical protein